MKANPTNHIKIDYSETLPNGVKVLIAHCPNYLVYKSLPQAVRFEEELFGKTGWNSDQCVVYYRDDANLAMPIET